MALKEKDLTIAVLKEDILNLKEMQESQIRVEMSLKNERYDVLDSIGVNSFDDLMVRHVSVIKENDKLKDLLETKDEEFKNLKDLYHEASLNLESLLTSAP